MLAIAYKVANECDTIEKIDCRPSFMNLQVLHEHDTDTTFYSRKPVFRLYVSCAAKRLKNNYKIPIAISFSPFEELTAYT